MSASSVIQDSTNNGTASIRLTAGRRFLGVVAVMVLLVLAALAGSRFDGDGGISAGERLDIQRATAQRELTAYAGLQNLTVTNIKVSIKENKLVASWEQGNQVCAEVPVLPPGPKVELYQTAAVKPGSGQCITRSGSSGLGIKPQPEG